MTQVAQGRGGDKRQTPLCFECGLRGTCRWPGCEVCEKRGANGDPKNCGLSSGRMQWETIGAKQVLYVCGGCWWCRDLVLHVQGWDALWAARGTPSSGRGASQALGRRGAWVGPRGAGAHVACAELSKALSAREQPVGGPAELHHMARDSRGRGAKGTLAESEPAGEGWVLTRCARARGAAEASAHGLPRMFRCSLQGPVTC